MGHKVSSSHPALTLGVGVPATAYRKNGFKPPSAYKYRSADMNSLADDSCQSVVMGTDQLRQLGLPPSDILTPALRLNTANGTDINIIGALFI